MKIATLSLVFDVALFTLVVPPVSDNVAVGSEDVEIDTASEMLLSNDNETRKRGIAMIHSERSERIAALRELILNKHNFVYHRESVEHSIELLGDLRAAEEVDLLIALIDYPFCAHPDARTLEELVHELRPRIGRTSLSGTLAPIESRRPAISSLIHIGEPSLNSVIEKIASIESITDKSSLMIALKGLEDVAPVRERLMAAIGASQELQRERLTRALEMLDVQSPPHDELLMMRVQEIWKAQYESENSSNSKRQERCKKLDK